MLRPCFLIVALCSSVSAAERVAATGVTWPVEAGEAAGYPYDVHYGGHPPGGYERRVGKPYFWSVLGGTVPLDSFGAGDARRSVAGPRFPEPAAAESCGCRTGIAASGDRVLAGGHGDPGIGGAGHPAGPAGDPYSYHFGPGYYRNNEFGHYRFPYYSYRRPWYDVGHPVRVRDTNLPW